MRTLIDELYLKFNARWNRIRAESGNSDECRFLVNLMEEIEKNNVIENNPVHLCNSCCNSYPECIDDEHTIEFGDGIGGDNICCCNKYEPLLERDYERGGYK